MKTKESQEPVIISVQEAVQEARVYFDNLFKGRYSDLMLEEIEFNEDNNCWYITLGYNILDETGEKPNPVFSAGVLLPIKYRRDYKVFRIRGEDGKVLSMKIRSI